MKIMRKKKLSIGIIGLGTVGSSVVEILRKREAEFLRRGYEFKIRGLCDKKRQKNIYARGKNGFFTTSYQKILNDPGIDVVVELIGGKTPAAEIILGALDSGKNIVTANKGVIARLGPSVADKARRNKRYFGFRATLTGCYAIIDLLAGGGPINGIAGVFNGTSNYILTRMKSARVEQAAAIREAQRLGYAEKDPSQDIEGVDSENKTRILSMLVFGFNPPAGEVPVEGIGNITLAELDRIFRLGYEVRPIGVAKRVGGQLDVRAHPALVPAKSAFYLLSGAQNFIEVDDELRGVGGAIYEGAGGYPAASAVVQDLLDAADNAPIKWPCPGWHSGRLSLLPRERIRSRYYLSFRVIDKPGALAGLISLLAKNKVFVARVERGGSDKNGAASVALITEEAQEGDVKKALEKVSSLAAVQARTGFLRVWDGIKS